MGRNLVLKYHNSIKVIQLKDIPIGKEIKKQCEKCGARFLCSETEKKMIRCPFGEKKNVKRRKSKSKSKKTEEKA